MYLMRNFKVEYTGTRQEIIDYILAEYEYDYFVQEYGKQLYKDSNKLKYVLTGLELSLSNNLPKRKPR